MEGFLLPRGKTEKRCERRVVVGVAGWCWVVAGQETRGGEGPGRDGGTFSRATAGAPPLVLGWG